MADTTGLLNDLDTDSRSKERMRGLLLAIPAFVLIVLPIAYFVTLSISTGRDEFGTLRDFLNHYHVALLPVIIPCLGALIVSLHLIIGKDFIRPRKDTWRN